MELFKDNDNLYIDEVEDNFKESRFLDSLKVLELEETEKNWLRKFEKNGYISKWIGEIEADDLVSVTSDYFKDHVNMYIENFLCEKSVYLGNRVDMLLSLARTKGNVHDLTKASRILGELMIELIYKENLSRRNFDIAVRTVRRLVSFDQSLLWRMYEEVRIKKEQRRATDFKDTLAFLPNMTFRLKKTDEMKEYKVDYIDGNLTDMLGIEVCKWEGRSLNVLMEDDLTDTVKMYLESALVSGVSEFYLTKGSRNLRTVIKSERAVEEGQDVIVVRGYTTDVTELDNATEKADASAYYDSLTKLPNRALFNKTLNELIDNKNPEGKTALMFIDIDDFKKINDEEGHGAGDKLLIEIARRLKDSVRQGDIVARLAGDEFTILCTNVKEEKDLDIIINRVLSSIAEEPFNLGSKHVNITLSVGIAVHPEDGKDPSTLIENADTAMYKAKNTGKNQYFYFEESMNSEKRTELQIQNELRKAIHRDEFFLNYQLQYDSEKDKISGIEALIRWNHPDRGLVSPGEFIKIAEDSGLIIEIGYWVLREGCRKMKQLVNRGHDDVVLGLNFSALQFMQNDLVDKVKMSLLETNLDPKHIMIEITESTSMEDVEKTAKVLNELNDLGVNISIDDFGTGYSSLTYLQEFPLDNLKIDKAFVDKLTWDKGSHALINSFVSFAENLDLDVVAEGVETNEHFEILKSLGCKNFQGYYFGMPVGFDDLLEMLDKGDVLYHAKEYEG